MIRLIQRAFGRRPLGRKNFQGNLFDRFEGLEALFESAPGLRVLDLGMSEGHIAYEFARRGAALIHGLEQHDDKVRFAARLFRDVPLEHAFLKADLAVSGPVFDARYGASLLPQYDLVLFLGVYHHLRKEMARRDLDSLLASIAARAASRLAVRSDALPDFEDQILAMGFAREYEAPRGKVGLLRVYRRP